MTLQGLFTETGTVDPLAVPVQHLHRNPDHVTSIEGAQNVQFRATSQKAKLLAVYGRLFELTDDEAAAHCDLLHATYWRRCGELRELGLIEDTGKMRPGRAGVNRIICRITDLGWQTLNKLEGKQ